MLTWHSVPAERKQPRAAVLNPFVGLDHWKYFPYGLRILEHCSVAESQLGSSNKSNWWSSQHEELL